MAVNIISPDPNRPIILDDSSMQDLFRDWTRFMTNEVNARSLIIGSGTPETVVSAKKGKEYFDDTGAVNNNRYTKQVDAVAGDTTKGWILG